MIIDTYIYEKEYIKRYGYCTNTNLSLKEAHDLYILCKTANNNDFHFSRGFYPKSDTICIFKSPENKWIVVYCSERNLGAIYGKYNNLYDACIRLIKVYFDYNEEKVNSVIEDFNKRLVGEYDKDEFDYFVNQRYTIVEEDTPLVLKETNY